MTVFHNVRVPIPKEHVTVRHTHNCPVEYVLEQIYNKRVRCRISHWITIVY